MLDNITALNIEELKNNKTIKVTPGKHAKPAKLSSGQTFKTKTAAIMDKVNTPDEKNDANTNVAPVQTQETEAQQTPEVQAPSVANEVPAEPTPSAPATQVEQNQAVAPAPELPADDKVLDKIARLNISYVEPTNSKDAGARRLKISNAVVTRTGNTLKVMIKNLAPTLQDNQPPIAMDTQVLNEAPTDAQETEAQQEVQAPDTTNEPTPGEVTPQDSGFFLGQKLNTEAISNEESEATQENEEPTEEDMAQSEITKEEKDARLDQIINANQSNIIDIAEAKKALEAIANRKKEISQLEKEMEEARKIRENQNQELQQLLAEAPKIIADLDKDKMSRTEELSNLRAEIIQYTDLINQKRGFQNNITEEYEDEESYGMSR